MQNICQHTPPPAAAAADASQTQRRGHLQFAVTRKNGPCKIETNTLSHNIDGKYTTNQTGKIIGIALDIFGWQKIYTHFDQDDK